MYGNSDTTFDEARTNTNDSDSNRVVRPAISLKSCVKWSSGNGSANNPYEIEMNGGC